jgi:hypothetical protein
MDTNGEEWKICEVEKVMEFSRGREKEWSEYVMFSK